MTSPASPDAAGRLDGRVALVTGAGSPDGIGYATARRLAALGAEVAIVSTTRRIHERATELGVTGFVADLTVEAEVGALADAIAEQLGPVDVLVNNAGLASKASPEVLRPVAQLTLDEWRAEIEGRKRPDGLKIVARTRPQDRLPDIAYVFAPLKHARLDYMVQKAVEMGASRLQPVLTRHTQVSRVNVERMRANVIEAAEQCGILSLATVTEPVTLERYLGQRDPQRLLVFCDEAADTSSPLQALQSGPPPSRGTDILIGPEGGFADEERAILLRQPRTLRLSLGPRVLRADTAAVAAHSSASRSRCSLRRLPALVRAWVV